MNVNRVLRIHDGDTLETVRHFLSGLWLEANLDAMLLPVELPDKQTVVPQVIYKPEELAAANPFAPMMYENTAAVVCDFLSENHGRLAVLLRPCELRALVELQKRHRVSWETPWNGQTDQGLLVIGADCPGTLPIEDFNQQISLHGVTELSRQALGFGQQGALKTSQLRSACQICESSHPLHADLTISVIGSNVSGCMLTIAQDEEIDQFYHLWKWTDRLASETEIVLYEEAVGEIVHEHIQHRANLYALNAGHYNDICGLWACFSSCTLCADCLDACPLYDGELEGLLGVKGVRKVERPLLSELVEVGRWLVSCSGCGMCQEACKEGVPLTSLVSMLSHRIQQELHYVPGEPGQALPWRPGNRFSLRSPQKESSHVLSR